MTAPRLALYELDVREPVAELDDGGQLQWAR